MCSNFSDCYYYVLLAIKENKSLSSGTTLNQYIAELNAFHLHSKGSNSICEVQLFMSHFDLRRLMTSNMRITLWKKRIYKKSMYDLKLKDNKQFS